MNFKAGNAVFIDRGRSHSYYPLGSSRRTFIDGQIFVDRKPQVVFNNHFYKTDDKEIASALAANLTYFENPSCYKIDPGCLPTEIVSLWRDVDKETRSKVTVSLAEGKSVESCVKMMKKAAEEIADASPVISQRGAPGAKLPQYGKFSCPVCDKVSEGKNAKMALEAHMETMHPEVPKEVLKQVV